MEERMKEALNECEVYARMGGYNKALARDVADDWEVDPEELMKRFENS